MTPNEYQQQTLRTALGITDTTKHCDLLIMGALGLAGETGEVVDIIKKATYQGHPLDTEHLAEELGDVAYYLAVTAYAIGVPLEQVLQQNIEKLYRRYPDGFSTERSVNRNDANH